MRLVAPWLALAVIVAGCAGGGTAPVADEAVPIGTLRGVVVDPSVTPVVGATVVLNQLGLSTVTDENGSFSFPELDPATYSVTASKQGYYEATAVAAVLADQQSPLVKIVLDQDLDQVPYHSSIYFQGYLECGVWPIACTYVNIITWIALCQYGICLGNTTTDRALYLQWLEKPPSFLQTELVWSPTTALGTRLGFAIGGATEEQLRTGQATTHNYTFGASPLMVTLQGEELAESGIGADRALLTQVVSSPTVEVPGGCVVYDPCGPGLQLMQEFETFTHAFYGYEPQPGWQFSIDGEPENAP